MYPIIQLNISNRAFLLASFFLFSCQFSDKDFQTNNKVEKVSNERMNEDLTFKLNHIHFTTNNFETKDQIKWYYPYQVIFNLEIENKTEKDVMLRNLVNKYGTNIRKGNFFITNDLDTIYLGPEINQIVSAHGKVKINFFVLDLPIFDSVYSRNDFKEFVNDLRKEYVGFFRFGDDLGSKIYRISNFESTIIRFYNSRAKEINLESIGYPLNKIPSDIVVIKPLYGIEY